MAYHLWGLIYEIVRFWCLVGRYLLTNVSFESSNIMFANYKQMQRSKDLFYNEIGKRYTHIEVANSIFFGMFLYFSMYHVSD